METIEIKDLEGKLLFTHSCEDNTLKKTIEQACLNGSSLSGANLIGADLSGANLRGAQLSFARLNNASLTGADLSQADLFLAILSNVDLYRTNLSGTNLKGANLVDVDLIGVDLKSANLSEVKADFFEVLDNAKPEIEGLKQALLEGNVDGRIYEGECACLVGTIANLRGVSFGSMDKIRPNQNRAIERWFLCIKEDDTPETNQFSAIAVEWIEEYQQKELV
jgi:uncharacterized protein YjbI with pentapeptide repeats